MLVLQRNLRGTLGFSLTLFCASQALTSAEIARSDRKKTSFCALHVTWGKRERRDLRYAKTALLPGIEF